MRAVRGSFDEDLPCGGRTTGSSWEAYTDASDELVESRSEGTCECCLACESCRTRGPPVSVDSECASGDETMDVWVKRECSSRSMEGGHDRDATSELFGCDVLEREGSGPHGDRIENASMCSDDGMEVVGEGEDDVKVGDG